MTSNLYMVIYRRAVRLTEARRLLPLVQLSIKAGWVPDAIILRTIPVEAHC